MKKFLSLLLAAMLLLSCTSAMATSVPNGTGDNASITVEAPESKYDSEATTGTGVDVPSVNTEVWLQVEATGQIDVTVPLVLVFKTNIDGGNATSPDTYKIKNNSTADLVVTQISSDVVAYNSGTQPMTLVAYDVVGTTVPDNEETTDENEAQDYTKDTYGLKLYVDAKTVDEANHREAWDPYVLDASDITANEPAALAKNGGLFQLYKNAETKVTAQMKTSPLTFVTEHSSDKVLDATKGLKLVTITYTVGINTKNAVASTDITTENQNLMPKAPANN